MPGLGRAGLPALPDIMVATHRAGPTPSSAPWLDLTEAVLLHGREGETFPAVVIDDAVVQLRDPAVRAKLATGTPAPGTEVTVRLERADPATRTVTFSLGIAVR